MGSAFHFVEKGRKIEKNFFEKISKKLFHFYFKYVIIEKAW